MTAKMEHKMAAVQKRTMCEETAVPNTLDASLAPNDQPKNTAENRRHKQTPFTDQIRRVMAMMVNKSAVCSQRSEIAPNVRITSLICSFFAKSSSELNTICKVVC